MSTYHHTYAITLHRRDVRDDSRFVSFYTQDFGKVQAVAVSAKKIKSHLAGHLEPFGIIRLGLARGIRATHVTSAQAVERYDRIWRDLELVFSAGYCLRFIYSLVREGSPDDRIFELLKNSLQALNRGVSHRNLKIFNATFTLKVMSLLGYQPELMRCLVCKKEARGENHFFSFARGGLVCHDCRGNHFHRGMALAADDVYFARARLHHPLADIFSLDLPDQKLKRFNTLVTHFFTYHLLT